MHSTRTETTPTQHVDPGLDYELQTRAGIDAMARGLCRLHDVTDADLNKVELPKATARRVIRFAMPEGWS